MFSSRPVCYFNAANYKNGGYLILNGYSKYPLKKFDFFLPTRTSDLTSTAVLRIRAYKLGNR